MLEWNLIQEHVYLQVSLFTQQNSCIHSSNVFDKDLESNWLLLMFTDKRKAQRLRLNFWD